MAKVVLVNPSILSPGYAFITPRWLFVIAAATPVELVGDPVLCDETLDRFDGSRVHPGDIVGISISTKNCLAGYRALRTAKLRGATVIMGGIHPTIFPEEPLEMGADAVVTGNGDIVWPTVVRDALEGKLRRLYEGGRIPGDQLIKARWDLLDAPRYMFPSVQTTAGCPENCSFCSVWVTDGREPRRRTSDNIIEEVTQLYRAGFRFVVFADDNFAPATLARINREPSNARRRQFERIRGERLQLFAEYDQRAPKGIFGFTQMTAEAAQDPEYLAAMYGKMGVRQAIIGVESYGHEGLASANKKWNPAGYEMIRAIQTIEAAGIVVLQSMICGLESDTVPNIRSMAEFAVKSGASIAQFTIYTPLPGTKDYYEMMADRRHRDEQGYVAKHRTRILYDRYWLTNFTEAEVIAHPNMTPQELVNENRRCWYTFYSPREILRRIISGTPRTWSLGSRVAYLIASLAFCRIFAGHGTGASADSVRREKIGFKTRMLLKLSIACYRLVHRRRTIRLSVPVAQAGEHFPPALVKIAAANQTVSDVDQTRR